MIKKIYISWRKKPGDRRFLIAVLKRSASNGMTFKYLDDFSAAQKEGLDNFFGFGKDAEKLSSTEIQNVVGLRVISKDKADKNDFLQFWEADKIQNNNAFALLALTQGKSPTDNFEFLADFSPIEKQKLKFITDLSGLSHIELKKGTVKKGDILSYRTEPTNLFDDKAIAVYKDDLKIGYIKKVHNKIFSKRQDLLLTVKAIDENGKIRQVFIKVEG